MLACRPIREEQQMSENKWTELNEAGKGYRVEDLGRAAFFLIPEKKLKMRFSRGVTVEDVLHEFLIKEYGAFTTATVPSFGIWRDARGEPVEDACRQYRVAFPGKERIPALLEALADILRMTGEECFYFEAGQYAGLVYPKHNEKTQ